MKKIAVVISFAALVFALPICGCSGGREKHTDKYVISARLKEDFTVSAQMAAEYYNNTETELKFLEFNLFPNAFREGAKFPPALPERMAQAYPHGVSYGGITVSECRDRGVKTSFEICGTDENILVLRLKEGVFPGECACVEIDFSLSLPECALRFGHLNGYINLGNWYPILCVHEAGGFRNCEYSAIGDPFYSGVADYSVTLTVPGEYTVAAGGECTGVAVGDKFTAYNFELKNARDFAAVLCKDFNVYSASECGVTVNLYFSNREFAEELFSAACRAVKTFSEIFGGCPYPYINVAVTAFLQGGMEYPSVVYVSDALDKDGAITAAVHEIAHQWWYAAVGTDQSEYAFLDEGLAEYSTLLFYEKNPNYGVTREGFAEEKNRGFCAFCRVFEELGTRANTVMLRPLSSFKSEYEYAEVCYAESFLMLEGLRSGVGDRRFFSGLKRFYEGNKFSNAVPEDLIAAFEAAGCDAAGYLTAWMEGRAVIGG